MMTLTFDYSDRHPLLFKAFHECNVLLNNPSAPPFVIREVLLNGQRHWLDPNITDTCKIPSDLKPKDESHADSTCTTEAPTDKHPHGDPPISAPLDFIKLET